MLAAFDPSTFINNIPGGPELVSYLRNEVEMSAKEAVKPYVIGAIAASGFAVLLSLVAIVRSGR